MTTPAENGNRPQDGSLWNDSDFRKVFTARVSASFGSMLGGLALVAILVADAGPAEMAALTAIGPVPGVVFGLSAGAWADRVRRRALMLTADFGRVLVIATVPIAYFAATIHIEHLYAVAFSLGVFRTLKEVASPAFLPSVVPESKLLEANSKITAGLSIVETTAFAIGGWIAQLSSAIATIAVQGAAYLAGGFAVLSIRKPEPRPIRESNISHFEEIKSGFWFVKRHRILSAIVVGNVLFGIALGMIGSQITLFAITEVGFHAGQVGMLYAIGGVASLGGSVLAMRLVRRFGLGNAMAFGWIVPGLASFAYPLAPGPLILAALFFAIPQLGDAMWTVHNITEVSLRQTITPARLRGRVNSLIGTSGLLAEIIGAVIAGVIAETGGLRMALALGAGMIVLAGLAIYLSPIRRINDASDVASESARATAG